MSSEKSLKTLVKLKCLSFSEHRYIAELSKDFEQEWKELNLSLDPLFINRSREELRKINKWYNS